MTILALHYATKDCLNYVPFTERALSFAYKVFVLIYIYYIYCGNNCSIQYISLLRKGMYNTNKYRYIHINNIYISSFTFQKRFWYYFEVNAVIINRVKICCRGRKLNFIRWLISFNLGIPIGSFSNLLFLLTSRGI